MSEVVADKSELPKNWELLRFEEIISPVKHAMKRGPFGSALKKSFFVPDGYKVYEQKNAIQDDAFLGKYFISDKKFAELEYFKVEPGDFIVSCSGTIGRIARIPTNAKPGIINQALLKIKINDEIISPQYFLYLFRSDVFQKKVLKETRGVAIKNIASVKDIKSLPVPLPPPEQQKRIVAKIEELFSHIDAGIKALTKAKQLLKQYRQSVLKAAVTGELTKEWREANKDKLGPASQLLEKIEDARNVWIEEQIEEGSNEARRLKNKLKKHEFEELDASLIPEGWESVSLTKLCLLVVDCHNKTAPYVDSGIPLIRTSNIREGVINFEEKMKYVNQETYEFWSRRCPPEPGDILFTREAPMGESAIIPENTKVCMGQRMMLLRVIHDLVDVNYLHIALMDPLFLKRIQGFKVGVGVQHLRVGDVEKAVIALPSIAEQKEIVRVANERLDSTTRLENETDHQLVNSEKNKQSILASAFSGKIKQGD